MAASISIFSSEHCFANSTDLSINTKKGRAYIDNRVLFKVIEASLSLRQRRVLQGADGNPICTLRQKIRTMHGRWEVFKGDSTKSEDLIFSVKRTTMIQWGIVKLEVSLPNNKRENVCDYEVHAEFLKQSCIVRPVQSSENIAKMKKNFGGDYNVTVNPNTDLAFIVTLIIILDKTAHVDEVSTTTFRLARMTMDPFDVTGLLFGLGETIVETIVETVVENAIENSVTNC